MQNLYSNNKNFTIGIEEEYMLCNPRNGDLINKAESIMDLINNTNDQKIPNFNKRFSFELILSEIESNTSPHLDVNSAISEVSYLRKFLKKVGKDLDFSIGISGTHPTGNPSHQKFIKNDSYRWVRTQMKEYARQNMTFSTHVHIGLKDPEMIIKVTNALRCWIAPLLALSVNSPFFNNLNTGMMSSRIFQFGVFPRTNIPSYIDDMNKYLEIIDKLKSNKSIEKPRHIWWKIRPHVDFGTVEFRMFDAQRSLSNVKMLAALSQALVHKIYTEIKNGKDFKDYNMEYLNDGLWKAASTGLNSSIINPISEKKESMKNYVNRMLEYLDTSLVYFDNVEVKKIVSFILDGNTEAEIQLKLYNNKKNNIEKLKNFLIQDVQYDL